MTHSIQQINGLEQDAFVALLGPVFEATPGIAAAVWPQRPFADGEALCRAMVAQMRSLSRAEKLALIRAHPDLGSKAQMAPASVAEQSAVGLDQLSPGEFEMFQQLNHAYREKFEFPFIIAVKYHTKAGILDAFRRRLEHHPQEEEATALAEIEAIAKLRLQALVAS